MWRLWRARFLSVALSICHSEDMLQNEAGSAKHAKEQITNKPSLYLLNHLLIW